MADVRPFPALRYAAAKVGNDVTKLVCPPYDVITPAERAALIAAHPRNFVRLELPVEAPGDTSPLARYERAAAKYRAWQSEGTLIQESAPALYAYLMRFHVDGRPIERRGFIAALRLEPWESRVVRPHERTLSGPKQDRLLLLRACRANFSPIWVLYRGCPSDAAALWDAAAAREPDLTARDRDECEHAVWTVSSQAALAPLLRSFKGAPVYIADGHHRYETALTYQAERRAAGELSDQSAANFAMAYFVEIGDPGLIVHGTHRLIRASASLTGASLRAAIDRWMDFTPAADSPEAILADLRRISERPAFGVWAPALGVAGVAVLRADRVPEEFARGRSAAWRQLDLAALHALTIDALFPQGAAALSEAGDLWYTRVLAEVGEAIRSGAAQVAFLVRETPVEQVIAVADAGDLMPEKSTYFHPKPVSGMVMASLEGEMPSLREEDAPVPA